MFKVLYLLSTLIGILSISIVLQSTVAVCKNLTPYSIYMLCNGVLIFLISVALLGYTRHIQTTTAEMK
jgi:hypothetical protein